MANISEAYAGLAKARKTSPLFSDEVAERLRGLCQASIQYIEENLSLERVNSLVPNKNYALLVNTPKTKQSRPINTELFDLERFRT
jgi:DNA-binding ferritin-like protein